MVPYLLRDESCAVRVEWKYRSKKARKGGKRFRRSPKSEKFFRSETELNTVLKVLRVNWQLRHIVFVNSETTKVMAHSCPSWIPLIFFLHSSCRLYPMIDPQR